MTRKEIASRLREAGVPEPEADARWLLKENRPDKITEWIERRCRREPLQYILGYTEFYGYRINVDRRVLIPRPETETLVEAALPLAKEIRAPKILDIGTGSGCIAIALAKELPTAQIVATDTSAAALNLARENAGLNKVVGRITFVEADLFVSKNATRGILSPDGFPPASDTSGTAAGTFRPAPPSRVPAFFEKYNLIVSNPPYIPSSVIPTLMPEVRDWEPRSALDGGPDGLGIIRRIITQAPQFLKAGGRLILEIGEDQGEEIENLVSEGNAFSPPKIVNDLAGRPRVAVLQTSPPS